VTGRPAPTKLATGRYSVDLPGVAFLSNEYATVCTTIAGSLNDPRVVSTFAGSFDLKVVIETNGGTDVDAIFSCSIYDL
jgi:hypothetical protein